MAATERRVLRSMPVHTGTQENLSDLLICVMRTWRIAMKDSENGDGRGEPPSISGSVVTNALSVSQAAMASEIVARMAMKEHEGAAPEEVDDPDEPSTDVPTLHSGQRFTSVPELQRAVQETALAEWNSDGKRHPWRRNGATAVYAHPPPIRPDALYYLSKPGVERVRRWSTRDSRIHNVEQTAVILLQQIVSWTKRARKLAASLESDDRGEAAFRMVQSILAARFLGNALDLREVCLEEKLAPFAKIRLRRSDYRRQWIVWKIELMFERNKSGEPTVRELALASILCGLLPDGVRVGQSRGATAAEVIAAEMRAMRLARKRLRAEEAASQRQAAPETGNTH